MFIFMHACSVDLKMCVFDILRFPLNRFYCCLLQSVSFEKPMQIQNRNIYRNPPRNVQTTNGFYFIKINFMQSQRLIFGIPFCIYKSIMSTRQTSSQLNSLHISMLIQYFLHFQKIYTKINQSRTEHIFYRTSLNSRRQFNQHNCIWNVCIKEHTNKTERRIERWRLSECQTTSHNHLKATKQENKRT